MKIELSHDLLAKRIHEKASDEDKMLLRIRKFVQDRFAYFNENNALLSFRDISYITPYLERISLEPHELRFIKRSKDRLWLITGTIALSILGVIGLIFYFMHQNHKRDLRTQEVLAKQVALYEEMDRHAEELSAALIDRDATKEELRLALLALQERNDTLVNSYATYKVQHDYSEEKLQKELNIAQSAKLSELAASATDQNRAYAFRLASKAWTLNPENKQAIEALYDVAKWPSGKKYSKQGCYSIIKKYKPKWGSLSDKELSLIFDPENPVTTQKEVAMQVQQTTQAPKAPTSKPPKMQDLNMKIQQQRVQIQQQVQKINLQQQKIRKKVKQSK